MEHGWLKALQRILDATAFENVGHMRDFEELLERSPDPEARKENDAGVQDHHAGVETDASFLDFKKGWP